HGKTPKDAASVRATHPIPAACGVYYFESADETSSHMTAVLTLNSSFHMVLRYLSSYFSRAGWSHPEFLFLIHQRSYSKCFQCALLRWDKHSYGYHGDDGHSFCSSGTGQPYGPTFTTGDVIGCCVNLINNTCFYTKNGHSLGKAHSHHSGIHNNIPPNLYPTVGLQTPGEVVDANFGQHPFVFDIEDYMREWRTKIQAQIDRFPIGEREGEWQSMIQK
ncbi:Ran-binding protein 9, partial [Goodea atripinnis]